MNRLDDITARLWALKDNLRRLTALNNDVVRAASDSEPATAASFQHQLGSFDRQIAETKAEIEALERQRATIKRGTV